LYICKRSSVSETCLAGRQAVHEIPTVFPSSHMTRENSIMKSAWSHARSTTKPYTVMPARLFSRYVTGKGKKGHQARQKQQQHMTRQNELLCELSRQRALEYSISC
jgi:hypothetical protein